MRNAIRANRQSVTVLKLDGRPILNDISTVPGSASGLFDVAAAAIAGERVERAVLVRDCRVISLNGTVKLGYGQTSSSSQ